MQLCYFLFLASMRLPSPSETAAAANGSPLEPPTFTDGEIAGQGAEKRPQPTEWPHSGLYPLRVLSTKVLSLISSFGIPRNNSRERSKLSSILAEGSLNLQTAGKQLTPSRGRSSRKEVSPLFLEKTAAANFRSKLFTRFRGYSKGLFIWREYTENTLYQRGNV